MQIVWTHKAQFDLERVYNFLIVVDKRIADRVFDSLLAAPSRLLDHPHIGERVDANFPTEVRRLLIGSYELRYSVSESAIYILRIWHTREQRT